MTISIQILHVMGTSACRYHWLALPYGGVGVGGLGRLSLLNHPDIHTQELSLDALRTAAMLGGGRLPTCLEVLRTYRERCDVMPIDAAWVVQVVECQSCGGLSWMFKDTQRWCSPACEEQARQLYASLRSAGTPGSAGT
jgi:hypothetical protein